MAELNDVINNIIESQARIYRMTPTHNLEIVMSMFSNNDRIKMIASNYTAAGVYVHLKDTFNGQEYEFEIRGKK